MTLSQSSNAIIAYEGRPTEVFEAILIQLVSSGMHTNYANHDADLILWVYDKDEWREALLRDWMIEPIIYTEAEGRKYMRATCKDALNAMYRKDDNCPILLDKMTFNIFSQYISMKKSKNSGVYLSATIYGGICGALTHM